MFCLRAAGSPAKRALALLVTKIRFLFSTRTKGLLLLLPLFCGTKTEVVFDFVCVVVVVAEDSRDDDALIPFCERNCFG